MRLDKYLAEGWVGQRKQVRLFIKEGKVRVNGEVVFEPATEVHVTNDLIEYDGEKIQYSEKRYYMFHKPKGCITARKDDRHDTVLDFFKEEERPGLFPVGRLDKDTEGLLLLTNDGEFDYQMMHPVNHVEKTYYFWALGMIDEQKKKPLMEGVDLGRDAGYSKPARLEIDHIGYYDEYSLEIDGIQSAKGKNELKYRKPVVSGYLTITEGKKHQVKRMLRAVDCYVVALKRISIGALQLDSKLDLGEYRMLTKEELECLGFDQEE